MGQELSLKTSSFEYFISSNTYDLIIAKVNELHRGVGGGEVQTLWTLLHLPQQRERTLPINLLPCHSNRLIVPFVDFLHQFSYCYEL